MKKRRFRVHLNIGTVIFGIIFIYLIITLILYASRNHVETYQVVAGPISGNDTFTALIIRNEKTVVSSNSGYVSYFVDSSDRVSKDSPVCCVTSEELSSDDSKTDSMTLANFRELASSASKSFSSTDFDKIYDFRYSLSNILADTSSIASDSGSVYNAQEDCIISTLVDGFENITEDDLSSDIVQRTDLDSSRLSSLDKVNSGDSIYRAVTGDEWYIYMALDSEQATKLSSFNSLTVKFLPDSNTERGTVTLLNLDGKRYAKITFSRGLIRYIDERYIDVELITNTQSGLKIPTSAVVKKEFYTIPGNFLTYSDDDGENAGFIKEVTDSEGAKSSEFVSATVYYAEESQDEDAQPIYYVDKSAFNEGDVILSADSDTKYTIQSTGFLEGVYCVNKGYAVFRKINIIDQNSEYCIIEEGTSYGLSLYDYIVRDSALVNENDIVNNEIPD